MLVVNTLGKSLGVYQRDLKAKQPTTFLCCSCLTDIGRLLQQVDAVTVVGGTHTRVHAGTLGACHPQKLDVQKARELAET